MFEGIDPLRFAKMTSQEARWFDNVKKAFYHSDLALQSGDAEDKCLEELFKGIDTAKTLRRSLLGESTSRSQNRQRFIDFLALDIPAASPRSTPITLQNVATGHATKFTLGDIIYDVRCMIHENENLNYAEDVDYHILLDWSHRVPNAVAYVRDGQFICNGYFIWNRLRELLANFITTIEAYITLATSDSGFTITINPAVGAIVPVRHRRS